MADALQQIADLLKEINRKVDSLPTSIKLSAKQLFATELSQITNNAGVLTSGEFRVGNGKEPGYGFTGVRMAYPPMEYGGSEYPFVSVSADVLQVGISLTDGKLYAGQGDVIIDSDGLGIGIGNDDKNSIKFYENINNIDNENPITKILSYIVSETTNRIQMSAGGNVTLSKSDVYLVAYENPMSLSSFLLSSPGYMSGLYTDTGFRITSSPVATSLLEIETNNSRVGILTNTPQDTLHVVGGILVGGDSSGYAGTIGLTNVTSGVSTGNGTVKMNGTTARDSTGWLKIMDGTTAKYIPFWTTVTG